VPKQTVREWLAEQDAELLLADGFDDAIIGIGERCSQPPVVVYDAQKCIDLIAAEGMDPESAAEFFAFNTAGAWVGDRTPIFLYRVPEPD